MVNPYQQLDSNGKKYLQLAESYSSNSSLEMNPFCGYVWNKVIIHLK